MNCSLPKELTFLEPKSNRVMRAYLTHEGSKIYDVFDSGNYLGTISLIFSNCLPNSKESIEGLQSALIQIANITYMDKEITNE